MASLHEDFAEPVVSVIKALNSRSRRRLLINLEERQNLAYSEICRLMNMSKGDLNYHLKELLSAGMIRNFPVDQEISSYTSYYEVSDLGRNAVEGLLGAFEPPRYNLARSISLSPQLQDSTSILDNEIISNKIKEVISLLDNNKLSTAITILYEISDSLAVMMFVGSLLMNPYVPEYKNLKKRIQSYMNVLWQIEQSPRDSKKSIIDDLKIDLSSSSSTFLKLGQKQKGSQIKPPIILPIEIGPELEEIIPLVLDKIKQYHQTESKKGKNRIIEETKEIIVKKRKMELEAAAHIFAKLALDYGKYAKVTPTTKKRQKGMCTLEQ